MALATRKVTYWYHEKKLYIYILNMYNVFSMWNISIHNSLESLQLFWPFIHSGNLQITAVFFFRDISRGFSRNLFFYYSFRAFIIRAVALSGLYLQSFYEKTANCKVRHQEMLETVISCSRIHHCLPFNWKNNNL